MDEFYRYGAPKHLQTHYPDCKDCSRAKARRYSRARRSDRSALRMARRREWFARVGPCRDCGSTRSLEPHHVDPDTKDPGHLWWWGSERREAELAKCIPLCSACHHKRHGRSAPGSLNHGTFNAYLKKKCRCDECVDMWRSYMRNYKRPNRGRVGRV